MTMRIVFALLVTASVLGNAYFLLRDGGEQRRVVTHSPAVDQFEVIRTKGGTLAVSTIRAPEFFQATADHTVLGVPVGQTTSQIRVQAVYPYHVELAPEWKVTVRDKTFIVIAPRVKPTLPVAIDTAKLERYASGAWSLFTGPAELDRLQRTISQHLATKAALPSYIQFQREAARTTVTEFVTKWLVGQERWQPASAYKVQVFFADEPIEALGAAPPPPPLVREP
ncbi:MAG TPA: hypothetical protein VLE45_15010 [Burkholderiaceae bacterium]|nr:hypothetical protein [Burkholderiaceae bacterium]